MGFIAHHRPVNEGSNDLYSAVKGAFVAQGTSLAAWCRENGLTRQHAAAVLRGDRNGPRSQALRRQIVAAAMSEEADAA